MSEKFSDPAVDDRIIQLVKETMESEGPIEPWTLLDLVTEHSGVDRTEARKALRGLKLSNTVVPAGDFTGELRLVET